jgi:hypothetical protein
MLNIDGLLNKQVKVYERVEIKLFYEGFIRGAYMVANGIDHSGIPNDLNLIIELSVDTEYAKTGDLFTLPLRSYRFSLAV